MTNEEAIKILKDTAFLAYQNASLDEINEAVGMAVEALKAQLSGEDATSDCISRRAALELGDNLRDDLPDDEQIAAAVMAHNEGIIEYQTKLSLLPSVQPTHTNNSNTLKSLDCVDRQVVVDALEKVADLFPWRVPGKRDTYDSYNEAWNDAIGRAEMEIEKLQSVQPADKDINVSCKDAISRQVAIDALEKIPVREFKKTDGLLDALISIGQVYRALKQLPPVQPEPLTDKEQRIFLAAMGREEKVCEEVDRNYVREPYEDSLMWICGEIKRKVKSALWTR